MRADGVALGGVVFGGNSDKWFDDGDSGEVADWGKKVVVREEEEVGALVQCVEFPFAHYTLFVCFTDVFSLCSLVSQNGVSELHVILSPLPKDSCQSRAFPIILVYELTNNMCIRVPKATSNSTYIVVTRSLVTPLFAQLNLSIDTAGSNLVDPQRKANRDIVAPEDLEEVPETVDGEDVLVIREF